MLDEAFSKSDPQFAQQAIRDMVWCPPAEHVVAPLATST
jgi:hypothetical protein